VTDFSAKKDWDNPTPHAMPAQARVPAHFAIGPVAVAPATVLAPMVGVTDTIFRRFIRNSSLFTAHAVQNGAGTNVGGVETEVTNQQSGCGLLMTEFTSADGLARMRESKRKRYLTFTTMSIRSRRRFSARIPRRLPRPHELSKTRASTSLT
jgi:tRNA-dihydrouridine synthase B